MPRVVKGSFKKIFCFSSQEIVDLINECSIIEAKERQVTQGLVVEEYILSSIARKYPDYKDKVQQIYKNRYGHLDPFLLID